jgi:hypothetical protein
VTAQDARPRRSGARSPVRPPLATPATGSWRLKALDALIGLATVNGALWNGREAFVSGILYRPHVVDRPILLAFNPKTNRSTCQRPP